MIRLLIWLGIIYLLYRAVRRWTQIGNPPPGYDTFPGTRDRIDDLMIQDPYCGVHFPRKEGHPLRHKGKDLYFCSPACRDNYRREHADETA